MQDKDYAWAAGILDGEETFLLVPDKRSRHIECRISCEMNDVDLIERLYNVLRAGRIYDRVRTNGKASKQVIISKRSDVYRVLNYIRPYMGIRRTKRIDEIISHLKERGIEPSPEPKEKTHALLTNTN